MSQEILYHLLNSHTELVRLSKTQNTEDLKFIYHQINENILAFVNVSNKFLLEKSLREEVSYTWDIDDFEDYGIQVLQTLGYSK